MDEGESILGAIFENDYLENNEDVEMLDVEEGEFVGHDSSSQINLGESSGGDVNAGNQDHGTQSQKRRRRANKKKNKKKRSTLGSNVTDVNRFVSDTCKRLKEKKSYMVYTAVGCLGVSALNDLVKEVDAIQACGGQMTADGRRFRTGGGVLWNIIKAQAPAAYKEIMKKTKEFEKQFGQQNNRQAPEQIKEASMERNAGGSTDRIPISVPHDSLSIPPDQFEQLNAQENHKSVHDRIRVPVSYGDLVGEDPKTDSV